MQKIISNSALTAIVTFITLYSSGQKSEKPNFVLFMADDCSYYDLGCFGNSDSKTPNIDRFAAQGISFTKAYQSAPMSSPTRHNLLTGLWPVKTGAFPNHTMVNGGTLSIIQHLRPSGYKVALIGKSHVKPGTVFSWDLEVPLTKSNDIDFESVDSFIEACSRNRQPFCLFVMSNQPHTPWNKGNPAMFNAEDIKLPPFYVDIPETRKEFCKYMAEINYMDGEFGTLLAKLEKHKIVDNSVVVYLSEQGNSLPFAKWTCYDAGVHSAFMVRWPGEIKPGLISDALVEYIDIVPTFLEIADVQTESPIDGKSIVPVITGKVKEHKQYTFSIQTTRGIISGSEFYGIRSVADKKYRYILNLTPEETFKNVVTESPLFKKWQELALSDTLANWITDRYQHRPAIELYDLERDKYCMNNIANEHDYKAIVHRMDKVLNEWMTLCGDKGQATEMEALKHMPGNIKN